MKILQFPTPAPNNSEILLTAAGQRIRLTMEATVEELPGPTSITSIRERETWQER